MGHFSTDTEPPEGVQKAAETRPVQPDEHLLTAAGDALRKVLGTTAPCEWRVLGREERPRSTIFRLEGRVKKLAIPVFYKTDYLTDWGRHKAVHLQRRRYNSLRAEEQFAPKLKDALEAHDIEFDYPLVVRPELFTGVRMGIHGRPVGRAFAHSLPGRRSGAVRIYEKIGLAMRIIEEVGRAAAPRVSAVDCMESIVRDLELSLDLLPPALKSPTSDRIQELFGQVDLTRGKAWMHGDVSATNILLHEERIALVDFSWRLELVGRDVAQFLARINSERLRSRRWSRTLGESMLKGYGHAHSAPWELAYIQRLLRSLRWPRVGPGRQWALQELQGMVSRGESGF